MGEQNQNELVHLATQPGCPPSLQFPALLLFSGSPHFSSVKYYLLSLCCLHKWSGSSKMFEELWMPLRNIQCFYQLHSLPCHPLRSCVVSIQPPWSFLAFGGHAAYCLVSQGLGTVRFTAVTKPNLIVAGHAGLWYPHETGICMERSSMGCTMLNGRAESHQEGFSYHFYACNG